MTPDEPQLRHHAMTVRGRYWVVAPETAEPAGTWVGFHGYGEDAEQLLHEMRRVPRSEAWALVAIQALHPFYKRSGDVVASWMTKLDRELAIADNLEYVAGVLDSATSEVPLPAPFVYLGFSQGTAMAYRAAIASRRRADAVIALAGDLPVELDDPALHPLPPTLIGRGSDDSWYTAEKEEADRRRLEAGGAAVEVCRFDGGHEWTTAFRDACSRFLAARAS